MFGLGFHQVIDEQEFWKVFKVLCVVTRQEVVSVQ